MKIRANNMNLSIQEIPQQEKSLVNTQTEMVTGAKINK